MKPGSLNINMAEGSATSLGEIEVKVDFYGISVVQKIVVRPKLMKSCIFVRENYH